MDFVLVWNTEQKKNIGLVLVWNTGQQQQQQKIKNKKKTLKSIEAI